MNFQIEMAPNQHFMLNSIPLEPVSRTYQYRKIMKPMLERKRRARINKCLDELKDLMTGTLQADGENISKLEKADILELTVRHLHRLREHNALFVHGSEALNVEKFWAGFQHCATEVAQFLSKYDRNIGGDLIKHMANYIPNVAAAAAAAPPTPTTPPAAPTTANYQRFRSAVHQHFNQQQQQPPPSPSPPSTTRVKETNARAAAVAAIVGAGAGNGGGDGGGGGGGGGALGGGKLRFHPYGRGGAAADLDSDGVWRPW